jgi:hypothetical protein
MDENQWKDSPHPLAMIACLRDRFGVARTKAGRRRLKLYTLAALRSLWDVFEEPHRRVVVAIEDEIEGRNEGEAARLLATIPAVWSYVDDQLSPLTLREPLRRALQPGSCAVVAEDVAWGVAHARGVVAFYAQYQGHQTHTAAAAALQQASRKSSSAQAELLREIFGNPFRPPPKRKFPAEVVGLAQACYDDHAHYPLLADALDDLGEADAAAHCRLSSHVKGCHVVDWVLGRV